MLMRAIASIIALSSVSAYNLDKSNIPVFEPEQCTAIIASAGASAPGVGSMTTHTNDCADCDFRLAKIPAASHKPGSMRKIWAGRAQYPRYIGDDRGEAYKQAKVLSGPDYFKWDESVSAPVGEIPQVEHTYAYLDGVYAIQNEHQLSMGESTCGAILTSKPIFDGGKALLEMSELSRIAMERCKTARCAIQTMGDLATTYGYYGAVWVGDDLTVQGEAGETMTINDKTESWMFHILPDDTGASAVWTAQRIPEGHVSVVANGFRIGELDLSDEDKFMGSDNIKEVALRAGLWKEDELFHFTEVFGQRRGHLSTYVNRRVWRVFSLAAPSLKLSPDTDMFALDYPFSVQVDKPLTVADVSAMNRDYYSGTKYDTSKGPSGGPFGNPARYDGAVVGDMTRPQLLQGRFERTISLFRTSYSFVTQSRSDKPDYLGVVWFGMFTPHVTAYIPVYSNILQVPEGLSVGSLFVLDKRSNYWGFLAVGNYAAQWFVHTIQDIKDLQNKLESKWYADQEQVENLAVDIHSYGGKQATSEYLTEYTSIQTKNTLSTWWDFFDYMIGKYHDGMAMNDVSTDIIAPARMFYPRWWLESVGFWGNAATGGSTWEDARDRNVGEFEHDLRKAKGAKHDGKVKEEKEEKDSASEVLILGAASPVDVPMPVVEELSTTSADTTASAGHHTFLLVGLYVGVVAGVFGTKFASRKSEDAYMPL